MKQNQPQTYGRLIEKLETDLEIVTRRLEKMDPAAPGFRAQAAQKVSLERGLAHLRELSDGQKSKDAGSEDEPKARWFKSSQDVVRRRQIVLNNPEKPAKSLCKVLDGERVPLPNNWERRYNVTTWEEAYEDKGVRACIQRIISTDKKAR